MKRRSRTPLKLPENMKELIKGLAYKSIWNGYVADVYRFADSKGKECYYLKRHKRRSNHNSLKERDVIDWLQGKLPVAEIAGFESDRSYHYLLLKPLAGTPAHKLIRKIPEQRMIELMVKAMMQMHSISIEGNPFDETIIAKLGRIRYSIDKGYLRKDIYNKTSGCNAEADFSYLAANIPDKEELVFTHGDFCLPNFLLSGDDITGFVDLGEAGVCDRYMDISTLAITMCYNYKRFDRFFYYCRLIFKEYGIEHPDWSKLQYYHLVNEML
ncbi:MAG: aminoglycoside 3'-phosphotransferase [Candidatus Cloacimonetes bacterium]|nr:aminoglycoside 3'-phosphotransferase [Candidatus Cloacimonadota bacterium]